jgi:predicted RNA-binding protein with PIN domain
METLNRRVTNSETVTYASEVETAVRNAQTADSYLEGLCSKLLALIKQMINGIAAERTNALTATLNGADELRDDLLTAFILFIKAFLAWKQEETASAAQRLLRIVNNHGGNFGKESREIESGLYNSLLNELAKAENAVDVATLGLTVLVAQMKASQEAFEAAYQQWSATAENKQEYVAPTKIRNQVLVLTDDLVSYLETMQKANAAVFNALALQVDQMTTALNKKVKQRHATKATEPTK